MKKWWPMQKQSEKQRQSFVKATWRNFHKAIDTSDSDKLKTIYKQMKEDVEAADSESDLM